MFSAKFIQESFGLQEQRRPRAAHAAGDRSVSRSIPIRPCAAGAPDLLLSAHRAQIMQRRDKALAGFDL